MSHIRVELYGLARRRAGVAEAVVEANASPPRFGDVLCDLARQFPSLGDECIEGRQLSPGFTANIDGERFVNDPEALLPRDCSLLIMSSDAGG